ncbi:MAG TPA: PilW family protein [Steroidobacteraceae bacterium]|nr:PilW family protein [Steroidobacteraceae bacterium]
MRRARGFSMVELMIAITLALVVSAAVLAVFVASRNSFQATSGTASLADGGRFALDFIQASVRSAGYMACNTSQRQLSLLNAGPSPIYYNFIQALGGYEATNSAPANAYTVAAAPVTPDGAVGDWKGGLDPALTGLVVKHNDVLVVYSTLHNAQSVYVTSIVDGATTFTVNGQGSLSANQLAVISDCAKSVAFWVTGISGAPPSVTVTHSLGGSPGNSASALPLSFEIGSQVAPIDTTVFYIGQGADGDGALFEYDLNAGQNAPAGSFSANELVPDIEAMQVLYGVDTTGTQTVAEYVTADQVPVVNPTYGFNAVISVKVAILAASPPGAAHTPAAGTQYNLLGTVVTAPRDTRARQVFEMTIGVRNLSS